MNRFQSTTCTAILAAAMIATTAACGSGSDGESAPPANNAELKVGEVPGKPKAAEALRPWAADLVEGFVPELVRKCWTVAPERVESMYFDKEAILAAIEQPGTEGQFAYIWQDASTRVSVKRSEVESGYACPYVSYVEDRQIYTNEDAKYRVFRYLQRTVGNAVSPEDTEEKYPLECRDLSDESRAAIAATLSYQYNSMKVSGNPDDVIVELTRLVGGNTGQLKIHSRIEDEGYCISSAE